MNKRTKKMAKYYFILLFYTASYIIWSYATTKEIKILSRGKTRYTEESFQLYLSGIYFY